MYREVAFFIEAEKVFDNVNWRFLKLLMRKMELGKNFINVVEAIYQKQIAMIIINNEQTNYFRIERGMPQGYPLSLLSFIMMLEVLLRHCRQTKSSEWCNTEVLNINIKHT